MKFFATLPTQAVIATIFGTWAWLTSHMVEKLSNSPTIEYDISKTTKIVKENKFAFLTIYQIKNISYKVDFNAVLFSLGYDPMGRFLVGRPGLHEDRRFSTKIVATEIALPITSKNSGKIYKVQYKIANMPPSSVLNFEVYHSSAVRPSILFRGANAPTRFVERNFETWLVRNEIEVLFALALVWTVVAATILIASYCRLPPSTKPIEVTLVQRSE